MKKIEEKFLKHDNFIGLSKLLETDEQLKKVSKYLKEHNLTIHIHDGGLQGYDSQSGWQEYNVILEGVNLSGNGYCFSNIKLINHIDNYRKNLIIKNTKEYKLYKELKEKYKSIDDI